MTLRKLWRAVYEGPGDAGGVCFMEASDEAGVRAFFAQAFPQRQLVSVTLEQVHPRAVYEPKARP